MPRLCLVVVVIAGLGISGAQAEMRRPYVDPPPITYPAPAPPTADVDATGSDRAGPPMVADPLPVGPYGILQRSGCPTATYMTGPMMDRQVRVYRC